MASEILSKEYIVESREIFDLVDKDEDGFITVTDLREAMRGMGKNPTDDELRKLIFEADLNKDGMVSFAEFLRMNSMRTMLDDIQMKEAFQFYDANSDGLVSESELKGALDRLGMPISDEEAKRMINVADTDGDGQVSYSEFVQLMKKSSHNT